MTSPPSVVTVSAWRAERRFCLYSLPWPMSRNDRTLVISQKT